MLGCNYRTSASCLWADWTRLQGDERERPLWPESPAQQQLQHQVSPSLSFPTTVLKWLISLFTYVIQARIKEGALHIDSELILFEYSEALT